MSGELAGSVGRVGPKFVLCWGATGCIKGKNVQGADSTHAVGNVATSKS